MSFLLVAEHIITGKTTKFLHDTQAGMEQLYGDLMDVCDIEVLTGPDGPDSPVVCEWFATCTNPADHIEPHSIIPGGVPCCKRCASIGR